MITRSDNNAATTIRNIVGNDALVRPRERVGIWRKFVAGVILGRAARSPPVTWRSWMFEIERHIPKRHRQLRDEAAGEDHPGPSVGGFTPGSDMAFKIHFKGGWAPSGNPGWTINQIAQLGGGPRERDSRSRCWCRENPSMGYGVGDDPRRRPDRLLKKYPQPPPSPTTSNKDEEPGHGRFSPSPREALGAARSRER